MKTICIITHSLNDYQNLKPLMKQIQEDQDIYLTVGLMERNKSPEMEVLYISMEEEGYVIYEKTDVLLKNQDKTDSGNSFDRDQSYYNMFFERFNPDMIVLSGNNYETFFCAVAAVQKDIPIAHIAENESNLDMLADSYHRGLCTLGSLHFASSKKYQDKIIQSGKRPDRVFNIGSLKVEQKSTVRKIKDAIKEYTIPETV